MSTQNRERAREYSAELAASLRVLSEDLTRLALAIEEEEDVTEETEDVLFDKGLTCGRLYHLAYCIRNKSFSYLATKKDQEIPKSMRNEAIRTAIRAEEDRLRVASEQVRLEREEIKP